LIFDIESRLLCCVRYCAYDIIPGCHECSDTVVTMFPAVACLDTFHVYDAIEE